jgi:type VI secretion system ImpM family protein
MFGFLKNNKQTSAPEPMSQIGCFGKLPICNEFVRFNVNERSVLELDEWLQQGYSHHSRDVQTRHEKSDLHNNIYHFVFTGNGEHSFSSMGTMMGSHDKCGRQYPFVVYKLLPIQATEALVSTLPCAYRAFFENTLNLCSTDWSRQPITLLKKWMKSLNEGGTIISRRMLIASQVSALLEVSKKEFWCDIFKESALVNAPLIIEMMKVLLETVLRKSPLRTSWGIEIPLPGNDRSYQHVSFWVNAAECLLGDRGWRPHYIWGGISNRDRQRLYLFFRPVSPIFFSHLLGHRVDNGILIDLEEECKTQKHVSDVAERIGSLDTESHMINAVNEWSSWSRV